MEALVINKKNVFYWSLYDFAKAIVVITFALYFSQWLVIDNKVADIWYNLIFVGASILLLATAPVLAIIADKQGRSLIYLRLMAFLLFLATAAASLFAVLDNNQPAFVLLAGVSFLFSNYFYQFSLIFYNGFLEQLAPPQKQGFVSGIGYASNWLGDIFGLLVLLPLATGALFWFGHAGRAQTLLPATLLFGLLALSMLLLFRETRRPAVGITNFKQEYKNLVTNFVNLCKVPGVGRFLLGYFLFNDAILTIENNFAIYLQQVYHINDQLKSWLLLALLIASVAGAFVCGWLADKVGLKKSLMATLAVIIILLPALALTHNFQLLFVLTIALGFVYGSVWVVTRAILIFLVPKQQINHGFSFYTLTERFATFIGPVAWGLTILLLKNHQIFSYRLAVIIMAVFVFIGTTILAKIPSDREV